MKHYNPKDVYGIDFETRSGTDIKRGLGQYFADPEADVFMLAHKPPGLDTVDHWDRGVRLDKNPPPPVPLLDHVASGGLVSAWNVAFEIKAWNTICVPRFGWPELKPEQCIDTMCISQIHNLPGDLFNASRVLGLGADKEKSTRGKHLVRRLTVKQKPSKAWPDGWVHDEELYREFVEYNKQDVVAEFAVLRRLRPWTQHQRDVWLFTHRMNQRGLPLDVDACAKLDALYRAEQSRLNAELNELTKGAVPKATKRAELLDWVNTRLAEDGYFTSVHEPTSAELVDEEGDEDEPATVENARADYLRDILAGELPDDVRRALEIRLDVASTAPTKFKKKLLAAEHDDRVRGAFVAFGAGTGRWSSRGPANFQNAARPILGQKDIDLAFDVVAAEDNGTALFDQMHLFFGDRLTDLIISCVRGAVAAPPGWEFLDADLSSIENRVAAWIAGQDDVLARFAEEGFDQYVSFAAEAMYNVPLDQVTKQMRQVAKSAVLGCFGAETLVLTDSGWKRIVDVALSDKVHDGVEFVEHQGVVDQGVKEVINFGGVLATPDHLILGEEGWGRADTQCLRSAVSLVRGLWSGTSQGTESLPRKPSVFAEPAAWSPSMFCEEASQKGALTAARFSTVKESEPRRVGPASSSMTCCAPCGSTGVWPQRPDAPTQRTQNTRTTEPAASPCATPGCKTPGRSCAGSSHSPAGTTLSSSWTEWTTISGTARRIVGWLLGGSKHRIPESTSLWSTEEKACAPLSFGGDTLLAIERPIPSFGRSEKGRAQNRSSQVKPVAEVRTFDVVNAGPRRRFVILTDEGPVIVHNCVFGQGAKGLVEYAKKMGVVLTLEEAQRAVKAFRTAYAEVKNCWYACGNAAVRAIKRPGEWTRINDKLRMIVWRGFLWLELPSGRLLAWYAPEIEQVYAPWTEKVYKGEDENGLPVYATENPLIDAVTVESVDTKTRKFKRHQLIGSSIYQSAVQGTAADILAEGVMAAEEDGLPSVLLAHDQSLVLVPEGTRSVDELIKHMTAPRPWREDLPLAAEGQVVKRFAK